MEFFVFRADQAGTEHGAVLLRYISETGVHKEKAMSWETENDVSGKAVIQLTVTESAKNTEAGKTVCTLAARLADYILEQCEESVAGALADRRYSFAAPEDRARAERFWLSFLNGEEAGDRLIRERRRELLRSTIEAYLLESPYLDLGGFIAFRLNEYKEMLQETIDISMEEYLLDQQYEEFIQLLQYFVHFQEPLTPLVHLIHHQGQDFSFFNQFFTPLHEAPAGLVVAKIADQDLEMEDKVVSTLISLSPDRILLHTLTPEATIISTIRKIFGDRVQVCLHCPQCSLVHSAARKRDQECHGGS